MTRTLRWFVLLALALLAPRAAAQEAPGAGAERPSATVRYWNRDVVTLHSNFGPAGPAERARQIEARLAAIPESAMFEEVVLTPVDFAGAEVISVSIGPYVVLALMPEDADLLAGETLAELGERVRKSLTELQAARRAQGEKRYIAEAALRSLVATALLVGACWLVLRLRRRILARVERFAARSDVLVVRKIDLRREAVGVARTLLWLAPWAAWIALVYLWATYVLTSFPYTEPWGRALGHQLVQVVQDLFSSAVASLPGILAVVVIVLVARAVARLSSHIFQRIEHGHLEVGWLEADSARAARRLTVGLIWMIAIVAAYPYVPGSRSEAFKGLSVLIGLMISLGSSGVVNQVMSGFVVVMSRSLRTGDFARIGSHTGRITEVGLLSVRIHTGRGEQVTVPNAVVLSQEVVNYTRLATQGGVVITTGVTIGYDAPWRQVHAMLLEAARCTPALATEPAPFVRQLALSDFFVEYVLVAQATQADDAPLARSELHGHIQDVFNEHGVQIMSPHFEGQPGERVVVPRERWHAAPAQGPERA